MMRWLLCVLDSCLEGVSREFTLAFTEDVDNGMVFQGWANDLSIHKAINNKTKLDIQVAGGV